MTTVSNTATQTDGPVPTADDASREHMSTSTQKDFRVELTRLRANAGAGPRDSVIRIFGIALIVIGILVIFLAYNLTHAASDVRDQMEMLTIAALGTAVAIVGSVLYAVTSLMRFMRFWLLRVIYEQRDLASGHAPSGASD